MENKRVRVKLGGRTSGIISSHLRAATIDSDGYVVERFAKPGVRSGSAGYLPRTRMKGHRTAAVRLIRHRDLVPVSRDPQDDLTTTSG